MCRSDNKQYRINSVSGYDFMGIETLNITPSVLKEKWYGPNMD